MYLKKEKRENGRWRTLQLCIWVLLVVMQMAVVMRLEVHARTHSEFRQVEQEIRYDAAEAADEIPGQIEAVLEEDGNTVIAVCKLEEQVEEGCFWQDDFVLPVTFHVYDADYYLLGDQRIPGDHTAPCLQGHEDELLILAGLNPEYYRIEQTRWTGGVYVDEQGELCRDGAAVGQKLMRRIRARYVGSIRVPVSSEQPEIPVSTEDVVESESAWPTEVESLPAESGPAPADTGHLEEAGPEQAGMDSGETAEVPGFWIRLTRTFLMTVGIGGLLLLLGLVLLAGLRMAKYMQLWYINRRNKKRNK